MAALPYPAYGCRFGAWHGDKMPDGGFALSGLRVPVRGVAR